MTKWMRGVGIIFAAISLQMSSATAQEAERARAPAVQHELVTEYVRNPVEYRALIKETLEGHLGALGLIAMRRAPDQDQMPFHADALVQLTATHASLYPEGSETARTRDSIWSNREEFESASSATAESAQRLRDSIELGDLNQIMGGLVGLGESCESCHARFRVPSDE